ncbi:citrulline utilization hydrolase CtlX [Psychromonas arctica]|uniref:citrulline utilization hydrolase CtlX n=1 Tax=Psychromonas arctica TaxID=168275 RepID=UPI002FD73EE5
MSLVQSPNAVVMICPWNFYSNPETSRDNAFQNITNNDDKDISGLAKKEFDSMVDKLESNGVRVHVFNDYGEKETPDSVFPNNWLSTHSGGNIAIHSMYSPSRRRERRNDVIELLKSEYRVQSVIDFSGLEYDDIFLEGTGAMVLDHIERVAYTAKSNRANDICLERFCTTFGYEPMAFESADKNGTPIYHTNVMMAIGTDYAMVCLNMIVDLDRRAEIKLRLEESGREVIDLSFEQIDQFAGNALELTNRDGKSVLALSQKAYDVLTAEQMATIEKSATLLPISIPTIELAGGSVRCMLAGIHLKRRTRD